MVGSLAWGEDRQSGLVDTAVCTVRFANGALATADVSFNGAFGYDVRAEVFGSGGMMAVGDGRDDNASLYTAAGVIRPHSAWFKPMFAEAYTAELAHFVECARTGSTPAAGRAEEITGAVGGSSTGVTVIRTVTGAEFSHDAPLWAPLAVRLLAVSYMTSPRFM